MSIVVASSGPGQADRRISLKSDASNGNNAALLGALAKLAVDAVKRCYRRAVWEILSGLWLGFGKIGQVELLKVGGRADTWRSLNVPLGFLSFQCRTFVQIGWKIVV